MRTARAKLILIRLIALAASGAVLGIGIALLIWWATGRWEWMAALIGLLVLGIRTVVFRAVYDIGRHFIWRSATLTRWHAALTPTVPPATIKRHPKEDHPEWAEWRES